MVSSAERSPRSKGRGFPERIGRYRILMPIASGGMATVYLARVSGPHGFSKDFALKLTHEHLRTKEKFVKGLYEEARIAARINHRNVVQVVEVGQDQLGVYLVMEYVEGDTLSALRLAAQKLGEALSVRVGLRILVDALQGLHAAHELRDSSGNPMGLIHRDFSPENILVGLDGIGLLSDFGIAKAVTGLEETATGVIKGKLAYMAPEQARGSKMLDRRTDVWSGGVMAWEILSGKRLYGDEGEIGILLKVVNEPPMDVREAKGDIPEGLAAVVRSALTMDMEKRCPSALEFASRLTKEASAAGLLGDTVEVAEYVQRLLGPKIEDRRRRISLAAADNDHRVFEADDIVVEQHTSSSGVIEAPKQPELQVPVATQAGDVESSPVSLVAKGPPELPVSRSQEQSSSAVRLTEIAGSRPNRLEDSVIVSPRAFRRPRFAWLGAVVIASVVGAAVAAVILLVVFPSGTPEARSASSSSSVQRGGSEAVVSGQANSAVEKPQRKRVIDVRANVPIASFDIGTRHVDVNPPRLVTKLDLVGGECSVSTAVVVHSEGGRSLTVSVTPTDDSIELKFSVEGDLSDAGKVAESLDDKPAVPATRSNKPRWRSPNRRRGTGGPISKKRDTGLAPNPYGGI